MNRDHWEAVKRIFDRAAEVRGEAREELLRQVCAGDHDLQREVERLLAADALSSPLDEPIGQWLEDLAETGDELDRFHQIGVYEVMGPLGRGGMGVVHLARDPRLERLVAIKLLPADWAADPTARQRLLHEARTVSRLDHPNICTLFDVGETEDGRPYFVMAYYPGSTLRERLACGSLGWKRSVEIAIEICRGLRAAHRKGIVHRDVKPENVAITEGGMVKILDFGIARIDDRLGLTKTGESPGTPAYMSPEQVRGAVADERSDLWALGVVLYEMLAGCKPFEPEDSRAVLFAIAEEAPEPLDSAGEGLPDALVALVGRLLEKDPACRPPDAEAVLTALEGIGDARACDKDRGPSKSGRGLLPERSRERPARWGAVAGVLVLLFGLTAWLFLRPDGPHPMGKGAAGLPMLVAVPPPKVVSATEADDPFVGYALHETVLSLVAGRRGLQAISVPETEDRETEERELARAYAADEILRIEARCTDPWCRASLSRVDPMGIVRATSGPFQVPVEPAAFLDLRSALRIHLDRLFPNSVSDRESDVIEPEDFTAYLEIKRAADLGSPIDATDRRRLEEIHASSPGLSEALLLAAAGARRATDFEQAERLLDRGTAQRPEDPRFAEERFKLEVERGRLERAETALERLEALDPGAPRVLRSRALHLVLRGEKEKALALRRRLARDRTSWKNLWYLADLEIQLGQVESARRHLGQLLEISSSNPYGLERLAELEWLYGDPAVAEEVYHRLLSERVTRQRWSNLGWSQLLQGHHGAAVESYERALELAPNHPLSVFNLALAEELGGDVRRARTLYRRVLSLVGEEGRGTSAKPRALSSHLLEAQALARLGKDGEAISIVAEISEDATDDPQAMFQVSVIYSLAGEELSARHWARRARDSGLSPAWFRLVASGQSIAGGRRSSAPAWYREDAGPVPDRPGPVSSYLYLGAPDRSPPARRIGSGSSGDPR